jgi:uroporphyrinogen decarboxylase
MNSRARVRAALRQQATDRVPIDLGSSTSSGISALAYRALVRSLGWSEPTRVYDVVQQVAQPSDAILDRFGADVISVGRAYDAADADWYDLKLPGGVEVQFPAWFHPERNPDGSLRMRARDGTLIGAMPNGATFFDQVHFPYLDGYPRSYEGLPEAQARTTWGAFPASPWCYAAEPDFWNGLRQRTVELRANTDRALVVAATGKLFEWGTFLRRIDHFMMDLVEAPGEVERFLDALLERQLPALEKLCLAVGDLVDVIRFGDDLGMDSGPLLSPRTYRRIFKPRHKLLCDTVRKHTDAPILLHSCGSIYSLLPDLLEAGFEAFNPVQITSRDMEPERLKREFGRDAAFWGGGADTRFVLNRGTPAEVRDHVRRNLEVFGVGGGYVFNPVHNILPDVPPENIVAMFDAAVEFGIVPSQGGPNA